MFAGPPREQTASPGTSIPMEDVAAGGKGIVLQLRRSRFCDGFGVLRDAHGRIRKLDSPSVRRQKEVSVTEMSSIAMIEPLQVKGIRERISAERPSIPSGVMQAVLMHALQLRRSCREVFLLCDIQRHSVAEAAAILGISRTAAKRRLQLARRRMDEVIERLCGEDNRPPS